MASTTRCSNWAGASEGRWGWLWEIANLYSTVYLLNCLFPFKVFAGLPLFSSPIWLLCHACSALVVSAVNCPTIPRWRLVRGPQSGGWV